MLRQLPLEQNFPETVSTYLREEYKNLLDEVPKLLEEARAQPAEITDEAAKTASASIIKRIRELAKSSTVRTAARSSPTGPAGRRSIRPSSADRQARAARPQGEAGSRRRPERPDYRLRQPGARGREGEARPRSRGGRPHPLGGAASRSEGRRRSGGSPSRRGARAQAGDRRGEGRGRGGEGRRRERRARRHAGRARPRGAGAHRYPREAGRYHAQARRDRRLHHDGRAGGLRGADRQGQGRSRKAPPVPEGRRDRGRAPRVREGDRLPAGDRRGAHRAPNKSKVL
jgi:transcription termination factor Rho